MFSNLFFEILFKMMQKEKLTIKEANIRRQALTNSDGKYNITYEFILTLRKSLDKHLTYENSDLCFEGISKINFYFNKLPENENNLLIDYHGKVFSVIANGVEIEFFHPTGKLLIAKKFLKENSENCLEVVFQGSYSKKGVGLHHFIDPVDNKEYLYTQFEAYDCNLALPAFDQPNLKAKMSLTLIAPSEWIVLSNEYAHKFDYIMDTDNKISNLTKKHLYSMSLYDKHSKINLEDHLINSIKDKKYVITEFKETKLISSYLYAFAAGPYVCHENPHKYKIPMKVYMRESLKGCGDPKLFMEITMAGVNFYESYFGIKFPFDKYDQIYVPEYNFGAMENPGLVTYNELYAWRDTPLFVRESRFCITVLHELAHMWFGNLVTMFWWDDLWLNEAFATFISILACSISSEIDPRYRDIAWISFNRDKSFGYVDDSKTTTHSVYSFINDTDESQSNFDGIVYYKGSSILKQMYYLIGHENFAKGLNNYFNKHSWSNTVYSDFVTEMIEASDNLKKSDLFLSGNEEKIDLSKMVESWLRKPGLTSIEAIFESDSNGILTKFEIKQEAVLGQFNNLQTLMIDILFIYYL